MARQARNDVTIERPARKISMTDGSTGDEPALPQTEPAQPVEPQTEAPAAGSPEEKKEE